MLYVDRTRRIAVGDTGEKTTFEIIHIDNNIQKLFYKRFDSRFTMNRSKFNML